MTIKMRSDGQPKKIPLDDYIEETTINIREDRAKVNGKVEPIEDSG